MYNSIGVMIGVVVGALEGVMIFFVPQEPHKVGVFLGAALKGALNGFLVAFSLSLGSTWWQGIGFGFLYGLILSLLVVLPEGGLFSKDAKYILPFGVLGGALIGFLTVIL